MKKRVGLLLFSFIFSHSLLSMNIHPVQKVKEGILNEQYAWWIFSDNTIKFLDRSLAGEVVLEKKFANQIERVEAEEDDITIIFTNGKRAFLHIKKPELHALVDRECLNIFDESRGSDCLFKKDLKEIAHVSFVHALLIHISFTNGSSIVFDLDESPQNITCMVDATKRTIKIKDSGGEIRLKKTFKKDIRRYFTLGQKHDFLYIAFADGSKKIYEFAAQKEEEFEDKDDAYVDTEYICKEMQCFKQFAYDTIIFSQDRRRLCLAHTQLDTATVFEMISDDIVQISQIPCCGRNGFFCHKGRDFFVKVGNMLHIYDIDNMKHFPFSTFGELPYRGIEVFGDYCIAKYSSIRYKVLNKNNQILLSFYSRRIKNIVIYPERHFCIVIYTGYNENSMLELYSLNQKRDLCKRLQCISLEKDQEVVWHTLSDNGKYLFMQCSDNKLIVYDINECNQVYSINLKSHIEKAFFQGLTLNIILKNGATKWLLAPIKEGGQFVLTGPNKFNAKTNEPLINRGETQLQPVSIQHPMGFSSLSPMRISSVQESEDSMISSSFMFQDNEEADSQGIIFFDTEKRLKKPIDLFIPDDFFSQDLSDRANLGAKQGSESEEESPYERKKENSTWTEIQWKIVEEDEEFLLGKRSREEYDQDEFDEEDDDLQPQKKKSKKK